MIENRLMELEIKVAYQEDLLATLNAIVSEQEQRIMRLQNTCQLLNDSLKNLSQEKQTTVNNSEYELPPHY